jgi:sarcosine oxidase subunit gamma
MPDTPTLVPQPPELTTGPLVTQQPAAARWILRGGAEVAAAAGGTLAVAVPLEVCRAATAGGRAALWLGPDEWLLQAPAAEAQALTAALEAALAGSAHSLVDVSQRQVALEVSGAKAATLLAAGCPLDLDLRAFPPGMCTRTMLARSEIVLWRTAATSFRVEVWRSFAAYVAAFLAEGAHGI